MKVNLCLVRQPVYQERSQSHEDEFYLIQCRYNLISMLNACLLEDGKVLLVTSQCTEYSY